MKLLKKIVFSSIYLFLVNFLLVKFNYNIPINIFSILITYLFGFPGIVMLLFFSGW